VMRSNSSGDNDMPDTIEDSRGKAMADVYLSILHSGVREYKTRKDGLLQLQARVVIARFTRFSGGCDKFA
jgi:hypothetical protein